MRTTPGACDRFDGRRHAEVDQDERPAGAGGHGACDISLGDHVAGAEVAHTTASHVRQVALASHRARLPRHASPTASLSARVFVRLASTSSPTPIARRWRAALHAVSPVPTISTRLSRRGVRMPATARRPTQPTARPRRWPFRRARSRPARRAASATPSRNGPAPVLASIGRAHLPQHLGFAEHQRLEAATDAEQVMPPRRGRAAGRCRRIASTRGQVRRPRSNNSRTASSSPGTRARQ